MVFFFRHMALSEEDSIFCDSPLLFHMRLQQPNSTRGVGVAHEMDFLSAGASISFNQISLQDSVFTDLRPAEHLTPET